MLERDLPEERSLENVDEESRGDREPSARGGEEFTGYR
jgi:hypothetical protein